MASTPPGWYQDPSAPGLHRWWDGNAWTDQAQPSPPAPPAYPGPSQPTAYPTPGAPMTGNGYAAPQYPSPPPGLSGYTPPPVPTMNFGSSSRRVNANHYSFITFGVCALYLVLANALHFVLIGFIPLSFGLRANRRKEPLALVAMIAAVAVIAYSLSLIF